MIDFLRLAQKRVPSMFSNVLRDRDDNIKRIGEHHPNLRTNAGLDWQAGILADYRSDTGTFTSVTATTLTDTGKAWTTDQWKGHRVSAAATTGTSCTSGTVLSNTATVLTIDRWISGTPGSGTYTILPGQAPIVAIALSTDATAPAAADTTLTSEITTGGLGRAAFTSHTHTTATATFSIAKTFTASAVFTVNKVAVFNTTTASVGIMPFESLEPSPPVMIIGDTLAQTITITY